jgi:hypothetical protein
MWFLTAAGANAGDAARAPAGKAGYSYFFFLGFLTSFFGLLSLAIVVILPYKWIITG